MEPTSTLAITDEQLAALNWAHEYQPAQHPIPLWVTASRVYDLRTTALVAKVTPEYRIYWKHGHVHFAPVGWDGLMPYREKS